MRGSPNGPVEFWQQVDRSAGPDACWPWTGQVGENGYGQFSLYGRGRGVHAVALHFAEGLSLSSAMVQVDHLCHTPSECALGDSCPHRRCCNPKHLAQVAARVNVMRSSGVAALNAGRSHCKNGHEYTEENTLWQRGGTKRVCRACKKAWERRYRPRRLALDSQRQEAVNSNTLPV